MSTSSKTEHFNLFKIFFALLWAHLKPFLLHFSSSLHFSTKISPFRIRRMARSEALGWLSSKTTSTFAALFFSARLCARIWPTLGKNATPSKAVCAKSPGASALSRSTDHVFDLNAGSRQGPQRWWHRWLQHLGATTDSPVFFIVFFVKRSLKKPKPECFQNHPVILCFPSKPNPECFS